MEIYCVLDKDFIILSPVVGELKMSFFHVIYDAFGLRFRPLVRSMDLVG